MVFQDRAEAGRELAKRLERYANRSDVLVLGLPRGGVPVAFEVARALSAPLDVFVVRRFREPGDDDIALGGVASGGVVVLNRAILAIRKVPRDELAALAAAQEAEVARTERLYRGGLGPIDVRD